VAPDQPSKGAATGAAGRPTGKKATLLPIPSLMAGLPPSRRRAGARDNGPIGVGGQPGRTRPVAESSLFAAGWPVPPRMAFKASLWVWRARHPPFPQPGWPGCRCGRAAAERIYLGSRGKGGQGWRRSFRSHMRVTTTRERFRRASTGCAGSASTAASTRSTYVWGTAKGSTKRSPALRRTRVRHRAGRCGQSGERPRTVSTVRRSGLGRRRMGSRWVSADAFPPTLSPGTSRRTRSRGGRPCLPRVGGGAVTLRLRPVLGLGGWAAGARWFGGRG